jgi:hypothetical protein
VSVSHVIAAALARAQEIDLPGESSADAECEGAKFHSPKPLRVHLVDLGEGRYATLCGTCRDNVAVLRLLEQLKVDDVPWRRGFGNQLRSLIAAEENDA